MNKYGYIYIGGDRSKPQQSKVGKTTRKPEKRVSETTNPDYYLYHSYRVPIEILSRAETAIHKRISKSHKRIKFVNTNRNSEWFECSTQEADDICAEYFEKEKTRQKKEHEKKVHLESFQQAKREILSHYAYYYHPVLREFVHVEKRYNEKRINLRNEFLPKYRTSYLNISGILSWLFTTGLLALIVSYLTSSILDIKSSSLFIICFIIFAIYNRDFLEISKVKIHNESLERDIESHIPHSTFIDLSNIVSALEAYEKKVKGVPLDGVFPAPPFKPEDLVEKLKELSSLLDNESTSDSSSEKRKPSQILENDQSIRHSHGHRASESSVLMSRETINPFREQSKAIDVENNVDSKEGGARWYHWLIIYLVIKAIFILASFGVQTFQ